MGIATRVAALTTAACELRAEVEVTY